MENTVRNNTKLSHAFSLVEIMIVVAIIGILSLIGIITVNNVRPAAEHSQLRSEVQVLNTAVKAYIHSGGDLSTVSTPAEIIAKLKTIRQKTTARSFVGFTGSFLDPRVSVLEVDASYKGPRAVFDSGTNRFSVTSNSVAGFKLELADYDDPGSAVVEETRADSALKYSDEGGWVWDYEDVAAPPVLNPTLVTKVNVAPTGPGGPYDVGDPEDIEEPILEKLLPPVFSIPTGNYDLGSFPMSVSLSDPNPSGSGKIIYGIINAANWQWTEYTGPIPVLPGDKVLAFVESLEPQEFHHSDPADELYDWTTILQDPRITATPNEIDARTGSTTITIEHDNNTDVYVYGERELPIPPGAFQVQYRLIPLVPGEGSPTGWITYTGPFDIGGPQFPHGFDVIAKMTATGPNFSDSGEASETIGAFYKLDAPIIESNSETISSQGDSVLITLNNPNPEDSSDLVYRLLDDDGNVVVNWSDYNGTFEVAGESFPQGFTVVAKAMPTDSYYRESGESDKLIAVNFFGIEITGKTIFILDSSGSMSTNDRIGRLKSATNAVLEGFDEDDSFAVIDYDSSPTILTGWGAGTSSRIDAAQSAVSGMNAGGATNYHQALQAGLDLNASEATQVIFLSDGYPNPQPDTPEEILVFIDQFMAQGLVRFDTVSLGTDQPILDLMAARGNGEKVMIEDE